MLFSLCITTPWGTAETDENRQGITPGVIILGRRTRVTDWEQPSPALQLRNLGSLGLTVLSRVRKPSPNLFTLSDSPWFTYRFKLSRPHELSFRVYLLLFTFAALSRITCKNWRYYLSSKSRVCTNSYYIYRTFLRRFRGECLVTRFREALSRAFAPSCFPFAEIP